MLGKNFDTKILITNIYNNINKCDTIFALLALLDRNTEKDGVIAFYREKWKSLRIRTRHWFKIGRPAKKTKLLAYAVSWVQNLTFSMLWKM